jgi:acyl-CoA dehydrogenase
MDFAQSPKVDALCRALTTFFEQHIQPNELAFERERRSLRDAGVPWTPSALVESLKVKAREQGLWNLFMPRSEHAPERLSNLEYAPLCEIMGRVPWSPEVFNCSAPDTGNMETLERYGSEAQKAEWLEPLLAGRIRSAFLMTEPDVASSDATNLECSIQREGDAYVINGRKWFASGAGDPRCQLYIVMGKTDAAARSHLQHSTILVPAKTRGVRVVRPCTVFGYDDAPHGHMEIELSDVRVPSANMLLGEGRGFEIAQGRLGPGRVHHCMRSIGLADRALELLCKRLTSRVAFGRPISEYSVWHERIADARCMIEQARLLVLKAAYTMDSTGNKAARREIAMIKVVAPKMTEQILDWAIQAHGGAGVSGDFPLAHAFAGTRSLRLADGPDEVHRAAIARLELERYAADGRVSARQPAR